MATANEKVSGYLPKDLFDLFTNFRKAKDLSASSALIVILSEYFGVDQKVDRQSSLLLTDNFVSKDRFEALENRLSELDKLVEQRFSSLRSELLSNLPKHIEAEAISVESSLVSELLDEPLNELPSELLGEPSISGSLTEAEVIPVESELLGEPLDEPPHLQLKIIDSVLEKEDSKAENLIHRSTSEQPNFTLSESPNSIQTKLLAKRLNTSQTVISNNKKSMDEQKFYGWLKKKDPDGISWQPVGGSLKGYSKGWIPTENTPSELLSRLEDWLAASP
jgi:hypothetical protein